MYTEKFSGASGGAVELAVVLAVALVAGVDVEVGVVELELVTVCDVVVVVDLNIIRSQQTAIAADDTETIIVSMISRRS